MNYFKPISTPADLSEASFEDVYAEVTRCSSFTGVTLYVSRNSVHVGRSIKLKYKDVHTLVVAVDWADDAWAVSGAYSGVYSEGA